jgi:hypothetical protein
MKPSRELLAQAARERQAARSERPSRWTTDELTRLAAMAALLPRLTLREIAPHFPNHGADGLRKRVHALRHPPPIPAPLPEVVSEQSTLFYLRCLRCGRPFVSIDRVRNRVCTGCKAEGSHLGPDMAVMR